MPVGSPSSEKYVVYTLDNEDTCSSSGLEDGQIVFRDPEHVSLQERADLKKNGNGRLRSVSYESSSHWGQKVSLRRKCCCLWNILLIIVLAALITVFVITYKDYQTLKSSLSDDNKTSSSTDTTSSTVSPTPGDIRQVR
jgi:hypothetical protein